MHKLKVPHETAEVIRNMHPHIKRKVEASLQIILSNPHSGKVLKGELAGLWSFRVGRLMIIYKIGSGGLIEIIAIRHRSVIYEETIKIINKEQKGLK